MRATENVSTSGGSRTGRTDGTATIDYRRHACPLHPSVSLPAIKFLDGVYREQRDGVLFAVVQPDKPFIPMKWGRPVGYMGPRAKKVAE